MSLVEHFVQFFLITLILATPEGAGCVSVDMARDLDRCIYRAHIWSYVHIDFEWVFSMSTLSLPFLMLVLTDNVWTSFNLTGPFFLDVPLIWMWTGSSDFPIVHFAINIPKPNAPAAPTRPPMAIPIITPVLPKQTNSWVSRHSDSHLVLTGITGLFGCRSWCGSCIGRCIARCVAWCSGRCWCWTSNCAKIVNLSNGWSTFHVV